MANMLNIILIEDHKALREVTTQMLIELGHHVIAVPFAEDVNQAIEHQVIDLFIIDLNLPGEDGLSLAQRMRKAQPLAGIIMVTARDSSQAMTDGYKNGADIYLVKPVDPQTLQAAVSSLAKRLCKQGDNNKILKLNPQSNQLTGCLGSVILQPRESHLLMAFCRSLNQQLETGEIASLLGMNEINFNKSTLEVSLVRLRKKMAQIDLQVPHIKAVRLKGYQMECSVGII